MSEAEVVEDALRLRAHLNGRRRKRSRLACDRLQILAVGVGPRTSSIVATSDAIGSTQAPGGVAQRHARGAFGEEAAPSLVGAAHRRPRGDARCAGDMLAQRSSQIAVVEFSRRELARRLVQDDDAIVLRDRHEVAALVHDEGIDVAALEHGSDLRFGAAPLQDLDANATLDPGVQLRVGRRSEQQQIHATSVQLLGTLQERKRRQPLDVRRPDGEYDPWRKQDRIPYVRRRQELALRLLAR